MGSHFGLGAAPILEPIVGIGIFTGGTIWLLTHAHLGLPFVEGTLFVWF